ncbi:MAG: cobalt-precorrin-4 C(11)-methyltransferase [Desulfovibrio sp.]|nr:cobalt-precorrin-4 C(11)-methyltransferase [Desulfovibrio sp.]
MVFAGSLVSVEMLSWCPAACERVDSAGLELEAITGHLIRSQRAGLKVVRLHTGDPSLYGASREQLLLLDAAQVPWRIIPGVTAAFAAAAMLGLEYTLPERCQTLILTRAAGRTPVPAAEELASLAAHGCSLAIYLSANQGRQVALALAGAFGPDAPVAVAQRVSWPDQRVVWTTARDLPLALDQAGIKKHALILAGPGVAAVAGREATAPSRLYDPGFSHGYRRGEGA